MPGTDFEEYGLSRGPLPVAGRRMLLTVDCEAFAPEVLPLWLEAMQYWAACARRTGLRFCFFLSVEDALRIRATGRGEYHRFLAAMRALADAGSLFYAHNHFVFDPGTGRKRPPDREPTDLPRSYGKRKSLFYDAVYCHRLDLGDWLTTIRTTHETLLADAGCRIPRWSAFRAGGWDYGSTRQDVERYLDALRVAGFAIDSSACAGVFDTPTWRVGNVFGSNAFICSGGLVEIAPCWIDDCGLDRQRLLTVRRLMALRSHRKLWTGAPGALVVVLHFDHLFHLGTGGARRYFAVTDSARVAERIRRTCRFFSAVRHLLRLESGTFESLQPGSRWPMAPAATGVPGVGDGDGPVGGDPAPRPARSAMERR